MTTDANLDWVFVKAHLVSLIQKSKGQDPLLSPPLLYSELIAPVRDIGRGLQDHFLLFFPVT